MTNRLVMPNDAVLEADVKRPNGRTVRYKGGIITPKTAHDERALREFGATPAGLGTGMGGTGKRCVDCGFLGWFITCGHCGGTCTQES